MEVGVRTIKKQKTEAEIHEWHDKAITSPLHAKTLGGMLYQDVFPAGVWQKLTHVQRQQEIARDWKAIKSVW